MLESTLLKIELVQKNLAIPKLKCQDDEDNMLKKLLHLHKVSKSKFLNKRHGKVIAFCNQDLWTVKELP